MIMEYEEFKNIFNKEIFENSKVNLIENIAKYPNRYLGFFRPTKPKAKILQNLLQSHEICFGNAFEVVIEEYLKKLNYEILNKNLINSKNEKLDIDQFFKKEKIYFVEQKIRDDHDSSKKRGQIQNFEKKLAEINKIYNENEIVGIFYFIDPGLLKNKKYYSEELKKMSEEYGIELYLLYGSGLFEFINNKDIWNEIIDYLSRWKKDIPDFPEINFDLNALKTFEEIKDIHPMYYRRILDNDKLFNEIFLTLFPEKKTLKLLLNYFKEKSNLKIYSTLYKKLEKRLE